MNVKGKTRLGLVLLSTIVFLSLFFHLSSVQAISVDPSSYFEYADGSTLNFNETQTFTTIYSNTTSDFWHFDNDSFHTEHTNVTVTAWYVDSWLNYTCFDCDGFGLQQTTNITKPNAVYMDDVLIPENEGWTFASPLITLYSEANSTVAIFWGTPIIPPIEPLAGQYYFRNDAHTVNNVTAYQLDTTNTAGSLDLNLTDVNSGLSVAWSFRVYFLHDGSSLSELTSTFSAQVSRSFDGYGYSTNTWVCPTVPLIIGFDCIEVRVYTRIGSGDWTLMGTYITPRLVKKTLVSSTWTFMVYTAKSTGSTISTFRFGDSASANSYISGIQFIDPNIFELMQYNLNAGNFFTFILFPYTYLIGALFYGLLLLLLIVPVYIKYHSLDVVLFMLILFGGAGGFFSLLMPISGLQIGFFVMAFAIGTLLYKVVTSR